MNLPGSHCSHRESLFIFDQRLQSKTGITPPSVRLAIRTCLVELSYTSNSSANGRYKLKKFDRPKKYRRRMISEARPCPPSWTLRSTRLIAISGDGSHKYNKVIRQPAPLHCFSWRKYDRPASVLSSPKLCSSAINSRMRSSILRPAAKEADSGSAGEIRRANSSAFQEFLDSEEFWQKFSSRSRFARAVGTAQNHYLFHCGP